MLVCDFCSRPSQQELAQCRCFHFYCDECANVGCGEDANFTTCSFCPRCSVECEINNYQAAVDFSKMLEDEERARRPPSPPPKAKPPIEYLCPITRELMDDPVVLTDGFSYERVAIIEWVQSRMISPMTGAAVANVLMPNTVLRVMINDWKEQNNYVAAAE